MMNFKWLRMQLKRHMDGEVKHYTYWHPQGSLWIYCLNNCWTGGEWFRILMIHTLDQLRLTVPFGFRISPTSGINKWKHSPIILISPMRHAMYSLSYHMVSEWRQALPMGHILSVEGSERPLARHFPKMWLLGCLLGLIHWYGQAMPQHVICSILETTRPQSSEIGDALGDREIEWTEWCTLKQ